MDRLRRFVVKSVYAKPSSERQYRLVVGAWSLILVGLLGWFSIIFSEMLFFLAILFGVIALYQFYRAIRPKKHQ